MQRVMVYDATQHGLDKKFLSSIWGAASLLGGFDEVIPLKSAADFGPSLFGLGRIDHLQLWGHGAPGVFLVKGTPVRFDLVPTGTMNPNGLVWLRCCGAFRGLAGQRFAVRLYNVLRCDVAGHTCDTNTPNPLIQSGGYALRPGETPHWDPEEGVGSEWGKPHTILTTTMNVPRSWYQRLPSRPSRSEVRA